MFIRFSLPKIFRLRGRSRKTEKQQLSSADTTTPQVPVPVTPSTVTPSFKAPCSPDPFASDLTIIRPSPEHYVRISSSPSHNSDSGSSASEMQIPIIVIDHDAAAAPVQAVEPRTTPAFLTTPPAKPSLLVENPLTQRTNRSKSIMFAGTKSSSGLSVDEMKPRRATMGARPYAKRVSKRETKIEFRRNSRRESQQFDFLRNSKRASEITLVGEPTVDLQGKLEVEAELESKRKSKRETKRVSKMSSPKQKRQSRWEKEINDPDTQEVLRALSGLN